MMMMMTIGDVLFSGLRPRPADDTGTADATTATSSFTSSITSTSDQVASSYTDLEASAGRCKTSATSATTSGDSDYTDCGRGVQHVPSNRVADDDGLRSSPPLPPLIDRSRRLLIDGRKWRRWRRRRRWPRINDGTSAAAGHRRAIDQQRPRTKLKTVEKMILYGMSMFFEKLELAVYMSLYKIKLLYTTLIAPLLS